MAGNQNIRTARMNPGLFKQNDMKILKKEMLFAINFSATQELDRQLQVEKAKNQALEARLLAVEEKLNVA